MLSNHPSQRRIAVIGGGVAGLTIATELLRRGLEVILFRFVENARCASLAATGCANIKGLVHPRTDLFRAKMKGHLLLVQKLQYLSTKVGPTLHRFDVLEPFWAQAEYSRLSRRIYHREYRGLFATEVVNWKRFCPRKLTHLPWQDAPMGAFRYTQDFSYSVDQFLAAMNDEFIEEGGRVLDLAVQKLEWLSSSGPWQVIGDNYSEAFSGVVLAAGDGINELLSRSALPLIPISGVAGDTAIFQDERALDFAFTLGKVNLVSGNGFVRFGSTTRVDGVDFKEGWEESAAASGGVLAKLFLELATGKEIQYRQGRRMVTKDRLPVAGSLQCVDDRLRRLFVFSGFYKSGFTLAHELGSILADSLVSDNQTLIPKAFRFSRLGTN